MYTAEERLADFRQVYAQIVVARAGCRDPAIRAAFERVPRHEFVGPGPWFVSEHGDATPSDDPALVYHDIALGLAPERGIPTGLPSLHARCLSACAPRRGDRVIHVGAGAGYFTAILAELVDDVGSVLAFEVDEELAARARELLAERRNVRVEAASGVGAMKGRANLVYVSAGVQQLPLSWLEVLDVGGRLAVPITPSDVEGGVLFVHHLGAEGAFSARFICRARFVPCIGTLDANASSRLATAFASRTDGEVRSLWLASSTRRPAEGAWFVGDGWWLSTAPPPAP
jgi:protein-L-isoaspartate(D-aspartate) O-methyltransferase